MSGDTALQFIGKYKQQIDAAVAEELARRVAEVTRVSPLLTPVLTAAQELSVGGKRLRGGLTILGYLLAGGEDTTELVRAACVMELFHLGLLIHDDIMDRDSLRRGVATIHSRYPDLHFGEAMAVCAGDETYGWGIEILSALKLAPERVNAAIRVWGTYFTRVGYGQMLDVMGEQRHDTGNDDVLQVLMIKSGEYSCVLPLQLGAALAGAGETLQEALKAYGMELGWVFQIRDDWLAEYGDTKKTGKPVGNDSREGRRTFATLYGREKTEAEMAKHVAAGKALLPRFPAAFRPVLEGLLDYLASREN